MLCTTISYTSKKDWPTLQQRLLGRKNPDAKVEAQVRDILTKVRNEGDNALMDYTRRFDCPDFTPGMLRIKDQDLQTALAQVPAEDLSILQEAIANVRAFHERQKENSWWTTQADGTLLGQMVTPVDRVGLYVPGGQGGSTPLISSIIMNAVPALVAGVPKIVMITPPRKDGSLNPYLLATAALLGIQDVYASGSAWAVAALAYGTQSIPACDVIAGPGNIYVATAKALLVGEVGIDMIAGPSEIAILADANANPDWLAADMLSQAEHDPLAAALLITPDPNLAQAVDNALERQTSALPRGEIAAKSLQDWGALIVTPDLDTAADLVNRIAPEHLELCVDDPWSLLGKIRHAGAIFMGHHCPEPVGDYFAGPNHVLPTLGTARFSSALSVQNFCKKSSIIAASPAFVQRHGSKIARLARLEGLEAHARSIEIRLTENK
ncbi:MAG: histidinol dehydrogenase [Desulfovibrionaceae bacterium]